MTPPDPTPRILQVERFRPDIRNRDLLLQFYYDETNNIRRLTLADDGVNVPSLQPFVLAGIAVPGTEAFSEWTALRQRLRVQPSALEVKFRHVASGDLEQVLADERVSHILEWLSAARILVHYSVLDLLHWALIDIIESLMPEDRFGINVMHFELKSELTAVVRTDPEAFFALLHAFSYPDVPRTQARQFMAAVRTFVEEKMPVDRNGVTFLLKQLLRRAELARDLDLVFLRNNDAGILIDSFSDHFAQRLYIFTRAQHVFDRETQIERALGPLELRDGLRPVAFRFADSKTEIGIQAADVVTGLFGQLFNYVQAHSLRDLLARKARFSGRQANNLAQVRTLIDHADAISEGFFHAVLPFDTYAKLGAFVHDLPAPPFMYE